MNKHTSNILAGVLIGLFVLIVAALPVRIEFVPVTTEAAEPVSQQEAQVVEYTLRTQIGGTPAMAFVGEAGDIDGVVNPELHANVGDTVRLTVINGDPVLHDLKIDEFAVESGQLTEDEQTVVLEFVVDRPGEFTYYCSIPGHRDIGMFGKLTIVGEMPADYVEAAPQLVAAEAEPTLAPAVADAVSIVRSPADVPAPIGDRGPATVRVDLTTQEVTGVLADGTTFDYFTFDGTVPGPMIRVRQGDTVEMFLTNATSSLYAHSIDLHAVTGPGGGAVYTQTNPGGATSFTFQAINPGVYVYHCATPSIPHHISEGMYGLIVVEPPGGLPPVDREFYVMQGDIYTAQPFGTAGHQTFDMNAMRDENASYLVFNGAVGGLTADDNALRANVGETVRIFFGVGGPNYTSSFHVIGEIFDRVYQEGAVGSEPHTNVQTTLVPSGGATIVEFTVDVPGRYILVDHSLSRLEKGLAGFLYVEGEDQPSIFHGEQLSEGSGH